MSKIKELLNNKDSVLVFDIDGVLAVMEFGNTNHFIDEEEWTRLVKKDTNFYTEDLVSKRMQNFLKDKDKSRVYIITKVNDKNELAHKQTFASTYYEILKENVYGVENDSDKLAEIIKIKDKYKELDDSKIIMIDDTVEILNDIMENTKFSTAHISSFLDL